jgi:hypothetical protein
LLIKQAMNQGYEVVDISAAIGSRRPTSRSCRVQQLQASHAGERGIARHPEERAHAREDHTLQLREFLIDSDIPAPEPGTVLFNRNDYTNTFFSIVEGSVDASRSTPGRRWQGRAAGARQFFGELGLTRRRRAATVRAGKDAVLIETPRRSIRS